MRSNAAVRRYYFKVTCITITDLMIRPSNKSPNMVYNDDGEMWGEELLVEDEEV